LIGGGERGGPRRERDRLVVGNVSSRGTASHRSTFSSLRALGPPGVVETSRVQSSNDRGEWLLEGREEGLDL